MEQAIDKAVLEKIRKLLALTASPNEAEAAIALSKAHDILKLYNMSMADITRDDPYSITAEKYMEGDHEQFWRTMLITEVCAANFCTSAKINDDGKFTIVLFGKEHNIASARVMIDYLLEVLERKSREIFACDRESYKMGMVTMFQKRLREMAKEDGMDCNALVVQERATIQKHLDKLGFQNKQKSLDVKYPDAFDKGYSDACKISLARQLGSRKKRIHYLMSS
jgi:hypothetical protein